MEKDLLAALDRLVTRPADDGPLSYTIYLIRPGQGTPTRTIVANATDSGNMFKFVRLTADVDRPFAIVQICHMLKGHQVVEDKVLHHVDGKGWRELSEAGAK